MKPSSQEVQGHEESHPLPLLVRFFASEEGRRMIPTGEE